MASSGFVYPGTIADDAGGGGGDWGGTIANVAADDGTYALAFYSFLNFGPSTQILCTNFGFTIPAGTIDGVVVEIERYTDSGGWNEADHQVQLIKGGTVQGANKANQPSGSWPTTPTNGGYGGMGDTWSLTLTPADVNASNFGVAVAVTGDNPGKSGYNMYIDFIRMTIYYTAGGASNTTNFFQFM